MKALEYTGEDKKKYRAVDAQSVLEDMRDLEFYNGCYNSEKMAENYQEIKKKLTEALIAEAPAPATK